MNQQKIRKRLKDIRENKNFFYALAAIAGLLIILIVLFIPWEMKHSAKKVAETKQKEAEQVLIEKKNNSTHSRPALFINARTSGGPSSSVDVPSYIQGKWRLQDTSGTDKKVNISFVDPKTGEVSSMLYVRFGDKSGFKLVDGETELKSSSNKYSFALFLYPNSSYSGDDKEDFTIVQNELQSDLANTFVSN
jgi:hypothetical protein